jgi:octaprenyl-diphosphate synthase
LDDVKNLTTGNPGKKRGDDIVEGKKSLPVLLYLHTQKNAQELVARSFSAAKVSGVGAAEVEELIAALTSSGAVEDAKTRGLSLIAEARSAFTTGVIDGGLKLPGNGDLLGGLIDSIS